MNHFERFVSSKLQSRWKKIIQIYNKCCGCNETNITRCGFTGLILSNIFATSHNPKVYNPFYCLKFKQESDTGVPVYIQKRIMEMWWICIDGNSNQLNIKYPQHTFILIVYKNYKNRLKYYILQSYYYKYDFSDKKRGFVSLSQSKYKKLWFLLGILQQYQHKLNNHLKIEHTEIETPSSLIDYLSYKELFDIRQRIEGIRVAFDFYTKNLHKLHPFDSQSGGEDNEFMIVCNKIL
jgi:hypothetical protein